MKNFAVVLYYFDENAGIWALKNLIDEKGVVHPKHFDSNFSHAAGEMKFFFDRIFCFLDHSQSFELTSYVDFLLTTLSALSAQPFTFKIGKKYLGRTILGECFGDDFSIIIVTEKGDKVGISYVTSTMAIPEDRTSPFFSEVEVPKSQWIESVFQALGEYFYVADMFGGRESSVVNSLYDRWEKLNSQKKL